MSCRLAKSSAVKLVRSIARRAGYTETRYSVVARARAGTCELLLRRQPGLHLQFDPPPRAATLRIGRGRSWAEAAFRAARMLGAPVSRAT